MASLVSSIGRRLFRWLNPPFFQGVSFQIESLHLVRAYYVAAELRVADLVDERPRNVGELAELTGTHAQSLDRMLRTLAAFGVFRRDRRGCYRMTRRARVLLSDGAQSMRSWLVLMGRAELWQGYARTLHSVRTGMPAFELAHGRGFYDYLNDHPELNRAFLEAMSRWTDWHCREVTRAYNFGRFHTVLDVGGGMGSLLAHILRKHRTVRGILFEQPGTVELARKNFEAAGLASRCQFVGGSFLDDAPAGADLCIVKHVLSDWDDEQASSILRNCHKALDPGGTLLVVGALVDPRNQADRIVKLVDLEMGALTGGVLRTRAESIALVERSGFSAAKVHATLIPDGQILECRKVAATVPVPHREHWDSRRLKSA
jgi:SAM-dependent methyltransferase